MTSMSSKLLFNTFLVLLMSSSALAAMESVDELNVTDPSVHTGHYQLNMTNSFRTTQGRFDKYGDYNAYPDGSNVWSLNTGMGLAYRLNHLWEFSSGFSIRQSQATYPSGSTQSKSVGNPAVDARYHLNAGVIGHATFHAGMSFPYKWSSMHTQGQPIKDSSAGGDGMDGNYSSLTARTGVGLSKKIKSFRLGFDGSIAFPFAQSSPPSDAPDGSPNVLVQRGPQIMLREGLSYALSHEWSLNSALKQSWSGARYEDGVEAPGSASRVFSTSVGASYIPSKDWRVSGNYETQFPFYAYLVNQPYSPSVSLGMSYTGL